VVIAHTAYASAWLIANPLVLIVVAVMVVAVMVIGVLVIGVLDAEFF
jgi:hypothetical protein